MTASAFFTTLRPRSVGWSVFPAQNYSETFLCFRPYFSTNPTFKIPLKNPASYLVEAGFLEKPTSQNPT